MFCPIDATVKGFTFKFNNLTTDETVFSFSSATTIQSAARCVAVTLFSFLHLVLLFIFLISIVVARSAPWLHLVDLHRGSIRSIRAIAPFDRSTTTPLHLLPPLPPLPYTAPPPTISCNPNPIHCHLIPTTIFFLSSFLSTFGINDWAHTWHQQRGYRGGRGYAGARVARRGATEPCPSTCPPYRVLEDASSFGSRTSISRIARFVAESYRVRLEEARWFSLFPSSPLLVAARSSSFLLPWSGSSGECFGSREGSGRREDGGARG